MYAEASLLCLPEEDSDAGFFDGEPTIFSDDYELGRKLGDGGYSEVFLCIHKKTRDEFAVKIIAKSRLDDSGLRALTEEVRVTRKVCWVFHLCLAAVPTTVSCCCCCCFSSCQPGCCHACLLILRPVNVGLAADCTDSLVACVVWVCLHCVCYPQLKHRNIVQMIAFYNESGTVDVCVIEFVHPLPLPLVDVSASHPAFASTDTFYLVSELMSGGELFEQIIQRVCECACAPRCHQRCTFVAVCGISPAIS
jgi:serine/threonine protein kinase